MNEEGVYTDLNQPSDHPLSHRFFKWKPHFLECLTPRLTHRCDFCENVELNRIEKGLAPVGVSLLTYSTLLKPPERVVKIPLKPPSSNSELSPHGWRSLSSPVRSCQHKSMNQVSVCRPLASLWTWIVFSLSIVMLIQSTEGVINTGNPDAKRLYDDLLSNYNKLVRPVQNTTDPLTVRIKLKLSQLIDVNLKNQIMTTNLWVEQFWYDYKLKWDPDEYGGVRQLHVPSDHIWRPDIVLYNNADGNFEVTLATKATLWHHGLVEWKPPAIYKSSCEIDVEYFPFDEQTCVMKFGSWTYDGFQVDLRHMCEIEGTDTVELGIDLSEFYMSVEWDILEVPAVRNEKFYTCCDEPYLDITFNITMRRKTLFYTVNLIIPCMGISFLTILVFYLPSDSGEKVSLSISILLSLTVFFLLLAEIIPPTSLVVPLLGKFVLFTMILDTFSICVTVVVLNVHFRTPQTHTMAPWVRRVFIHILPRLLSMRRPHYEMDKHRCEVLKSPYYSFIHTSAPACEVGAGSRIPSSCAEQTEYNYRDRPISGGERILIRTCNGLHEVRDPSYIHMDNTSTHVDRHKYSASPEISRHPYLRDNWSEHTFSPPALPRSNHSPSTRPRSSLSCSSNRHSKLPSGREGYPLNGGCKVHGRSTENIYPEFTKLDQEIEENSRRLCPEIYKALEGILFIAEHKKRMEESTKIIEDWKYVAMVMDRLFLWIFTVAVLVGTAGIILQAPTLYDDRQPIDFEISKIGLATSRPMAGQYEDDVSPHL